MSAVAMTDWTTANQQLLVAEFTRLRALLGEGDLAEAKQALAGAAANLSSPAAIDTITRLFRLSPFERDLLLLVCGIEMNARLAQLCAHAHPDHGQPWASFSLALATLPEPHWSAISPREPLRRWSLLETDNGPGLATGRLRVPERVLHYIGGLNELDHRLEPLLEVVAPSPLVAPEHLEVANRAARRLRTAHDELPLLALVGDDPEGQEDVARCLARNLGASLHALHARDIPSSPHEQSRLALLWEREAALLGSGLLIRGTDVLDADEGQERVRQFTRRLSGLVVLSGRHVPFDESQCPVYAVDKVDAPGQRILWRQALGDRADSLSIAVDHLASHYRLGARRISRIGQRLQEADERSDPQELAARLNRMCRGDGSQISALAQKLAPAVGWDDLVLPEAQDGTLRQILLHARHRIRVHHDWGFAQKSHRGTGIATLFAGESGTGKTLAAEVLANELGVDLYRVDLSAVVSKYIGDTEKNLRRIFDAAEDIGALLLFDEADALFGRRSEVKDSHDRYANIEVSYLLQRMEAYRGLAILTSNNRNAMDKAFQRRLRFVVTFPFPDLVQREAIWRVTFPADTPLGELDFGKLARLNVTGGSIRNIALNAAFLAAEDEHPVDMRHVLRAAHAEAAKHNKAPSDAETRGWV